MKTVRPDSKTAEFYNDGLVVFFYDESHLEAIREASPTILEGYGEDDASDPVLAKLAGAGLLVVYELVSDDEMALEVCVGSPLTASECEAPFALEAAQRAGLSLPSGRLCIESYNNLRLADFDPDEDDEDPGVVIEVPPGEYMIAIHGRAEPADEADDFDEYEDETADSPSHVIVLSAVDAARPFESRPLLSSFPPRG